jgi:hypothetical protein
MNTTFFLHFLFIYLFISPLTLLAIFLQHRYERDVVHFSHNSRRACACAREKEENFIQVCFVILFFVLSFQKFFAYIFYVQTNQHNMIIIIIIICDAYFVAGDSSLILMQGSYCGYTVDACVRHGQQVFLLQH